jgi:3-phosphoshikimate 1-carboxyvinyltransferase
MNLHLQRISKLETRNLKLEITGSKSETNRLLLLQALYSNIQIENASNSDDSEVMIEALQQLTTTNNPTTIDVHHAGTAMRFLTAFFAIQENKEVVITGSSRMKERPIKVLVDALQELGAEIYYKEKNDYPPLHIIGKKITKNKISIPANVSSQYISALLLVAPKLENGLEITLQGKVTSLPYINMTLALLKEIGVTTSFEKNIISVQPITYNLQPTTLIVESDWSSASYWYSIIALSEIGTAITLSHFKKNSLQGDAVLPEIYNNFGVETVFENNKITLQKVENHQLSTISFELNNSPDIAQTIAVTCFGLGITCDLFGLHTLKIKETNRLLALKTELEKLGAKVVITNDSLHAQPSKINTKNGVIITYQDHRMALAFAPLAIKFPIIIQDAQVVSKSYPTFWNDLKTVGFKIQEK